MVSHCRFERIIRAILVLCCLLVSNTVIFAKLLPAKDYRNGSLDAEFVTIVSQQKPNSFKIEEVFLGGAATGGPIRLPGFRLITEQQYGPDIVEPITPNTRILLYLRHEKDTPSDWEIVDFGNCFFWVQNPEQTQQLRNLAQKAIELRRQWEEVSNISDPMQRAAAWWPFLSARDFGSSVARHTKLALQKIAPASGDYFAEHFDDMPTWDRMDLYRDAGAYGGEKLHEKLTSFIQTQQKIYESYAATHDLTGHDAQAVWYTMPVAVRDSTGNIYFGIAGLASFQRRQDLPLIREIARWAVKYGQFQTCEGALDAFRTMPDEDNVAVISLIWQKFRGSDDEIFPVEMIEALGAHKYVQTVPLLAPLINYGAWGADAEATLTEIVGRDLGQKPGPWLVWYKTQCPETNCTRSHSP
jgi:hypothetical protein